MTDKKELMQKKVSEITADELNELKVALGAPGLPFPMARLEPGSDGSMQHTVGVLESFQDALVVYSHKDMERVVGDFFREMMTPSMMQMERDLILSAAPESEKFITAIFGDAASGKSHLFRKLGKTVHPQGAIVVDCGGMNMRELFFRTVIDYGQGQKEQLEKRLAKGEVQQANIDRLNEEFPGSVIEKNGRKEINWDAIGARKTNADGKTTESPNEATSRAKDVLELVYLKEGITQQTNSFGIKTVPGEVFESFWSGRPLFLDEFNKSKPGTLDTFQTFLQFANGEKGYETVDIYNPMATAGDSESPKVITLNRKDRKIGYFIGVSGNDTVDGSTTQDLSYSMETRLNISYIGAAELRDWTHRVSQIWTGLPLTTLYSLREADAKTKPGEFAQWLVDLRLAGLSETEKKAVPAEEIHLLQNFDKTVQAINQVAEYYDIRGQLSRPDSKLFENNKYKACEDEIMADRSKRIATSFRKAIMDFEKAKKIVPEVRKASEATWGFSLQDYFKKAKSTTLGKSASVLEVLGSNLVRVIIEDIVNDTTGMPKTQAALIELCKMKGICDPGHESARASNQIKLLGDLLKFDDLEKYGGAEKLKGVRKVLLASLKSHYPDIRGSDDMVISLPVLGKALKKLEDTPSSQEQSFIMPSDDKDRVGVEPLLEGFALPIYDCNLDEPETWEKYELVDFRAALAGLAMPGFAEKNIQRIWPVDLINCLDEKEAESNEAYEILMGKSKLQMDMAVIAIANGEGQRDYMYFLEDKFVGKSMLVGPEIITDELRSALVQNNISYVWNKDPEMVESTRKVMNTATKKEVEEPIILSRGAVLVNEFLSQGARERAEKQDISVETVQEGIASLICAWSAINELPPEVVATNNTPKKKGEVIPFVTEGTTLGQVLNLSKPNPAAYTSILKLKR